MLDRIRWFWWRVRLVAYMRRVGAYKKRLAAIPHAWSEATAFIDYFAEGYSPRDAFNEDMSYGD